MNKWDAVEKDDKTMDAQRKKLMNDFSFMSYAPIIFISAKTGQRVDRLFELIKYVDSQNALRVTTGMLNELLARATARVQPPSDKGRRLKIYYMTQVASSPPPSSASATTPSCSTSPTSGIWRTRSAPPSAWRARRSG